MIRIGNKLLFFSILGMILFYFLLVLYSNVGQVIKSLTSIKLEFIPLILLFIVISVFIKSIRQDYLLKSCKIKIPFKQNFLIYLSGLSLIFTPGGIGSVVKTKFFKDNHGAPIKYTISIVMMEIYHELLGLVIILAITIFFYDFIESEIAFVLGSLFVALIYSVLRYPKIFISFSKFLNKISIFKKISENREETQKNLHILTSPLKILNSLAITLVSIMFDLVSLYLIFLAFGSYNLNFMVEIQSYITAFLLGQMAFLPNGVGVTDTSFVGILIARKLDLAVATSVVLTVRFIGLWIKIGMGLIALKFLKKAQNMEPLV